MTAYIVPTLLRYLGIFYFFDRLRLGYQRANMIAKTLMVGTFERHAFPLARHSHLIQARGES